MKKFKFLVTVEVSAQSETMTPRQIMKEIRYFPPHVDIVGVNVNHGYLSYRSGRVVKIEERKR